MGVKKMYQTVCSKVNRGYWDFSMLKKVFHRRFRRTSKQNLLKGQD
jgi:hypothetical protein